MTPQIGDKFLNERGEVFKIVERNGDQFRCKKGSRLSAFIYEYDHFHIDDVIPEKQGEYWVLKEHVIWQRIGR